MQRIGVFVCHCGSNIAATVDVKKVAEMALHEPGVVHAEDYAYMCSEAGQELIHKAIKEKHLTGLVVCSCSPRMHETTFRNAAERAGLNPYMVEIANIREHCSWIHKDMEEATEKAVILMRAAVAKVNLNAPLKPGESRVTKRALVIGGGIAGISYRNILNCGATVTPTALPFFGDVGGIVGKNLESGYVDCCWSVMNKLTGDEQGGSTSDNIVTNAVPTRPQAYYTQRGFSADIWNVVAGQYPTLIESAVTLNFTEA